MIVLIDNYDSFVYNLYQRLGEVTGAAPVVYRNDQITADEVLAHAPTHIVISPGPGRPDRDGWFGIGLELIRRSPVPLLGVCLGHQGLAVAFGGRIARAPAVMHGKKSSIVHNEAGLFRGLPSPLVAMRYHSLVVEEAHLPKSLEITSRTEDGVIMGLRHKRRPLASVQFHPESIGTPWGRQLLENFVQSA